MTAQVAKRLTVVGVPPSGNTDVVQAAAAGMPDSYLACRELGHTWRPRTASWDGDAGCYDRTLRCPRCKTVRFQTLSRRGEVLSNHYGYKKGYLLKGLGRIAGEGRDALRLEAVTRLMGDPAGG